MLLIIEAPRVLVGALSESTVQGEPSLMARHENRLGGCKKCITTTIMVMTVAFILIQ